MNPSQIKQSIADNWITSDTEIIIPKPLIEFKGVKIAMLGNFSAIIGAAKSKKSYLLMCLIAEALKGGNDLFKFSLDKDRKEIIYIDTEQSQYETKQFVTNIKRMAGKKSANFKAINIRDFATQERIEIITDIIITNENASLIIIDGVRDLVDSINNEAAATQVNNYLLKWTKQFNKHIIVVIHTNKDGNDQARGHLGSEIVNKAETTLLVQKKNDQISKVSCKYSRGLPFETFLLAIDENGLPYVQDIENTKNKTPAKQKFDINFVPLEEIKEVLYKVLPNGKELKKADLTDNLQKFTLNQKPISRDNAILLIKRALNEHILTNFNKSGGRVMCRMQD